MTITTAGALYDTQTERKLNNDIVQDGEVVRTPMMIMDSQAGAGHALADAAIARRDAERAEGAAAGAYGALQHRLSTAWIGDKANVVFINGGHPVKDAEDAHGRYVRAISDGWKGFAA